ncbi:MAG: tRNA pseudouridine(38-40) synthase TruA [Burkholderiales bacterium]
MRIALGIEYDGTGFTGWQTQPAGTGVQDALERAIAAIAGHPVRLACAGRTDTGVHALAQVAHFETTAARPQNAWVRGVNSHLPPAVAVLWSHPVGEEFHARFSARARAYEYRLINRPVRPALQVNRTGWHPLPLDLTAMRAAAALIVGEHDFSSFRSSECQAKSPVKTLSRASVGRDGDVIRLGFEANAFLHHMVRNIVGCLIAVGAGRHPVSWMGEVLEARDRTRAAPTFAPQGLYLARIDYDARFGLPEFDRTAVSSSL